MTHVLGRRPVIGDIVLYDNGGKDIGEAGRVEAVVKAKKEHRGEMYVLVAGEERCVRFVAVGPDGLVWCINGPIGENPNVRRGIQA